MPSDALCCRVCGWPQAEPPWGPDGKTPSFAICDCCGVEFGYEDCSEQSAARYRQAWIVSGAPWHDERKRPPDWRIPQWLGLSK